jgi:hypothetical protein
MRFSLEWGRLLIGKKCTITIIIIHDLIVPLPRDDKQCGEMFVVKMNYT